MRSIPLSIVRLIAALGIALWLISIAGVLTFATSGFVNWAYPKTYATLAVTLAGLLANLTLLERARALRPLAVNGLTFVSLSLSALVIGLIAYVAT